MKPITPEQASALEQLFAAHFDGDPLRIALAKAQLVFLADVQGLPRELKEAA